MKYGLFFIIIAASFVIGNLLGTITSVDRAWDDCERLNHETKVMQKDERKRMINEYTSWLPEAIASCKAEDKESEYYVLCEHHTTDYIEGLLHAYNRCIDINDQWNW